MPDDFSRSGIFGAATIKGKGTVIIASQSHIPGHVGISNGEPTSDSRLKFIDGTLIVDNSKGQFSYGYNAFMNIPDFDANGYYRVTVGADAATATVVSNPTADTFINNSYVKIETPYEPRLRMLKNNI